MLDTNRLQPPLRFAPQPSPRREPAVARETTFISAEDFDATGILTGVDLCASSYWWVPELHAMATVPATLQTPAHATARTSPRSTAAA